MKIVIVGAGIGGLATALSLKRAGFEDISVYERAPKLRPLGVGINLLPHAVRELTELGLRDRLSALGTIPQALQYYNRFGQLIWSEPRGTAAGYRWPQFSVHRGRLQMMLADAVVESCGSDVLRLGHRLDTVKIGGGGARAVFDRDGDTVAEDADVLIGADGIHSAVRRTFHPNEGTPIWNGLTLWRGTARVPAFLNGHTMIMAGDDQLKFVAYPLSEIGDDGTMTVNFIAEQRTDGSREETADWNRAVSITPVAGLFREWTFDWLDVPSVIASADEILEYPMVDRDPLNHWTHGRITLIGDAAHAMYPNGSNGASQAILDARTLAYHLATAATPDDALARFEADRRPPTTALVVANRRQGPERVMVIARERAPHGFDQVHDVIPESELRAIASEYKTAAGFDPQILNNRASLTPAAR